MKCTILPNSENQQGFSLLEVFISITISLIVLAGVLQIFLNTRSTSTLQNGFSQLQENCRFIDDYVTRIIRLAGYRSPPSSANNFTSLPNVFTAALPYATGTQGTGPNGSDTLTIRYQGSGNGTGTPDGTINDCLMVPADANTMVTNVFSLSNNNELQCQALNANSATPNNTQILVSGVENFQVLYGEDTDGDYIPNRYVPINYAFLNLNNIVSIRVALLLRSDQPVSPYAATSTYYLIGATYTSPTDKYLRTEITFTIVLRNLIVNPL